MRCATPIVKKAQNGSVWTTEEFHTVEFPCGKCLDCINRRASGWATRLQEELKVSETAAFITLTYDDDHLDFTENGLMTVSRETLKAFHKRYKEAIRKDSGKTGIKYYAVSEYGSQTNRPHYHGIYFNIPKLAMVEEYIQRSWQKGHVHVANVELGSILYVTGYLKSQIKLRERDPLDDRVLEFSHMSKGLGSSWITKQKREFYKKNLHPYMINQYGEKVPFPRYYKDKIYLNDYEKELVNRKAREFAEENKVFESSKHKIDYVKERDRKVLREYNKRQQKL